MNHIQATNIVWHEGHVDRNQREALLPVVEEGELVGILRDRDIILDITKGMGF